MHYLFLLLMLFAFSLPFRPPDYVPLTIFRGGLPREHVLLLSVLIPRELRGAVDVEHSMRRERFDDESGGPQ